MLKWEGMWYNSVVNDDAAAAAPGIIEIKNRFCMGSGCGHNRVRLVAVLMTCMILALGFSACGGGVVLIWGHTQLSVLLSSGFCGASARPGYCSSLVTKSLLPSGHRLCLWFSRGRTAPYKINRAQTGGRFCAEVRPPNGLGNFAAPPTTHKALAARYFLRTKSSVLFFK